MIDMTRAEIVHGYQQLENYRDRLVAAVERAVTREHRVIPGGFEERIYVGTRLMEIRRYSLGQTAVKPRRAFA